MYIGAPYPFPFVSPSCTSVCLSISLLRYLLFPIYKIICVLIKKTKKKTTVMSFLSLLLPTNLIEGQLHRDLVPNIHMKNNMQGVFVGVTTTKHGRKYNLI